MLLWLAGFGVGAWYLERCCVVQECVQIYSEVVCAAYDRLHEKEKESSTACIHCQCMYAARAASCLHAQALVCSGCSALHVFLLH
jgi:hypothetical protein